MQKLRFNLINCRLFSNSLRIVAENNGHSASRMTLSNLTSDAKSVEKYSSVTTTTTATTAVDSKVKRYVLERPKIQEKPVDVLAEAIYNCADYDTLRELITIHVSTMKFHHFAAFFRKINDFLKSNDQEVKRSILYSAEFQALCNRSLNKLRFCGVFEVLCVINCLKALEIPGDTVIFKAALQMIRAQINDVSIDQLRALYFTMMHVKDPPEIWKALRTSIPLLLEIRIEGKELDFSNIDDVCKCLQFAAHVGLRPDLINEMLYAICRKRKLISEKQAIVIVKALRSLNFRKYTGVDYHSLKFLISHCNQHRIC